MPAASTTATSSEYVPGTFGVPTIVPSARTRSGAGRPLTATRYGGVPPLIRIRSKNRTPTRARRSGPPTRSIRPPSAHIARHASRTSGRRKRTNPSPPTQFMWIPSENQSSCPRLSSSHSPTVSWGQRFRASRTWSLISAQLGRRSRSVIQTTWSTPASTSARITRSTAAPNPPGASLYPTSTTATCPSAGPSSSIASSALGGRSPS